MHMGHFAILVTLQASNVDLETACDDATLKLKHQEDQDAKDDDQYEDY